MQDMSANRIRKPTNITLDPRLVEALDAWIAQQEPRTTRAAVIDMLIRRFLADEALR